MHGRVEGHLSPCLSTRTDARTKVIIERRHWRLSVNDTTVTVGGIEDAGLVRGAALDSGPTESWEDDPTSE
jgi:hypothetical protein